MLIRNLSFLMLMACGASHAMNTENLSEKTLKAYGKTLASESGNLQWQQLWQRTKEAGHLDENGMQARFTLPHRDIAELVKSTLYDADDVQPDKGTQAIYRRYYARRIVGVQGAAELIAICLRIDWKSVPDGTRTNDGSKMNSVSMLIAKPCQ